MQLSSDASLSYSSEDQRTSGPDNLLLFQSRFQQRTACFSLISCFASQSCFVYSWASLEKISDVLCCTGSSCWQHIWGWCPCLVLLVSSQLHEECLCFPQLLLFALLHLASVLSETRSVVWICVALGWASWVSSQGACWERAMWT